MAEGVSETPAANLSVQPPTDPPAQDKQAEGESKGGMFAGKYDSVESLEKGYLELQKKLSQQGQQPPATPSQDPPPGQGKALEIKAPPEPSADSPLDIDAILKQVGVDGQEIANKWREKGQLDESDYQKFAAKKYSRSLIDGYLTGQQLQADVMFDKATKLTGGDEQLNNLLNWAGTALNKEQMDNINSRLAKPSLMEGAILELMSTQQRAMGVTPSATQFVDGTPSPGGMALPKNKTEFNKLGAQARAGDALAAKTIEAMTFEQIESLPL